MATREMIPKESQFLVYLKWQDAHGNAGWFTKEDLEVEINEKMCIIEEVGWVVYEDTHEIHLVGRRNTWEEEGVSEYGSYQRIPKAWILKKKILTKGK